MRVVRRTARMVSGIGLGAVSALHAVWTAGSHWPARDRKTLAAAVIGNDTGFPSRAATATVALGASVAGVIAAGGLGSSPNMVRVRRVIGVALLTRAAAGGDVALAALGRPHGQPRFISLDNRFYRPLCALLGLATLIGARASAAAPSAPGDSPLCAARGRRVRASVECSR